MSTLEEMQLKVGQAMQLQLKRLEQSRLYTKLIGYLPGQAVIVSLPTLGEQAVPVLEGEPFVCRAFSGRVAFGFETRVLKVSLQPFGHLFLAYPRQVESVVVRKAARLALQQPATMLKSGGEQGELREEATLIDLSTTGAGVLCKPHFASVKETVNLLLPAREGEPELRVEAVVRSARPTDPSAHAASACQYGLEFANLSAEQSQAIERMLQGQLTRAL